MTTLHPSQSLAQSLASIRHYAQEEGRELGPHFEVCLYYNINVNEDREAAFQESKHFLDTYYSVDYPPPRVELGVALGSPQHCIDRLQAFIAARATTVTLRPTSYDQERQFNRVTDAVLATLR